MAGRPTAPMAQREGSEPEGKAIGQIPLKKMAVTADGRPAPTNPMNRLVPYLDLFRRLSDPELARLAGVGEDITAQLRAQVVAVCSALDRYADLLPRLADPELMRLTGASAKTVRFWRLCQPRIEPAVPTEVAELPSQPIATGAARPQTGPHPKVDKHTSGEYAASDSGNYSMNRERARGASESSGARPVRAKGAGESSGVREIPRAKGAGESSGVREITRRKSSGESSGEREVQRSRSAGESSSTRRTANQAPSPPKRPVAKRPTASLGVAGAPFPGYDYDPEEARKLEQNDDGIVIGLDLPDPTGRDDTDLGSV